ncbi:hypothetical protein [Rhizosphaericola mali]|uniref:Uncharacterized protein n=1 Tax=Rhizosphaericola mali TaxID=2545455 RepID=A0A5P2G935_9BACT|nr:hypothetical protein [Rhizosphaericola mali]QES88031.1 hypothetical protein E0W69_004920 [Rhizosphaericola mali]
MTKEEINGIIEKATKNMQTRFSFALKKRNTVIGYFINVRDYSYLNAKNYWYVLKEERRLAGYRQ